MMVPTLIRSSIRGEVGNSEMWQLKPMEVNDIFTTTPDGNWKGNLCVVQLMSDEKILEAFHQQF